MSKITAQKPATVSVSARPLPTKCSVDVKEQKLSDKENDVKSQKVQNIQVANTCKCDSKAKSFPSKLH